MKNKFLATLVLLALIAPSSAFAATYTVAEGDTWEKVSIFTGNSVAGLLTVNKLTNARRNPVVVGQKVAWISPVDVNYAKSWCRYQLANPLNGGDENYSFATELMYIERRRLVLSADAPNGIAADRLFQYRDSWKKLLDQRAKAALKRRAAAENERSTEATMIIRKTF